MLLSRFKPLAVPTWDLPEKASTNGQDHGVEAWEAGSLAGVLQHLTMQSVHDAHRYNCHNHSNNNTTTFLPIAHAAHFQIAHMCSQQLGHIRLAVLKTPPSRQLAVMQRPCIATTCMTLGKPQLHYHHHVSPPRFTFKTQLVGRTSHEHSGPSPPQTSSTP